ncbi:hypothetical protein S7711_10169 [Stachybotrys chartarum IBT 7711]|uniref:Uncharacterized protein n=1 Tax=Stachybotrys chartarum (strain CBS 109288 / IBT 7711) TaxID=1280523 RepID=A0A084B1X5_STACB|nr:hypothetical protein S7711_10169 [Stachybotrys chartarum IBT 7711]
MAYYIICYTKGHEKYALV